MYWRKQSLFVLLFLMSGLLISSAVPPFQVIQAQTDVITLDVPPEGVTIRRNPLILTGTVHDPTVQMVYINKVNAPVMVLGRRRMDMPGVPFPVVNGRFIGYAAFLGVGPNTVRVSYYDKNNALRSMDVRVVYNSSEFEAFDIVPDLRAESLRQPLGLPVELFIRLRNRTSQTATGLARLELKKPDGSVLSLSPISYTIDAGRRQEFAPTLETEELDQLGLYEVILTVLGQQGQVVSSDNVHFEIYRPEEFPFVDVSAQAGIRFLHQLSFSEGGGASWADYDNDGDVDLFVSNLGGPARLYRNNGNGTFTDVTQAAGFRDQTFLRATRAGVWGDYDNDGDRDLFVTSPSLANRLYRNNGNGTFTDVSAAAGIRPLVLNSYPAAWGDYNGDGFLDLYVSGNVTGGLGPDFQVTAYPNQLYRNNGNGTFTEVGLQLGVANQGPTLACQWVDYDYDGDVDLFVINDFSAFTEFPGTIYRNDGPDPQRGWKFTDIGREVGFHDVPLFGMGFTMGDYDGDGDQDYFVSNLGIPCLFRNDGSFFSDATLGAGVTAFYPSTGPYTKPLPGAFPNVGWLVNTWGVQFWDYDLDGWLDLYIAASGMGTENFPIAPFNPNWLYHNNGDGTFTDVSQRLGLDHPGRTRGIALADYDNDGDLDVYLANNDQYGVLLRNDLITGNNWIKIELRGTVSNRDAIGSRIVLEAGGRRQIRLYPDSDPQSSQAPLEQVFGLGQASRVDRITIYWPSGIVQTLTDIDPSAYGPAHKLIVTEPNR